jgi:hypothetical protein
MIRSKAVTLTFNNFGFRFFAATIAALVVAAGYAHGGQTPQPKQPQPAQRVITIIMADGRSGKTMIPDNFVIRFNHLNAIRNETLTVNDDGTGKLKIPAEATYISVQGAYHSNIDLYVNCDAVIDKDISTLHWYSIDDILKTGVTAPNECHKGKFARSAIPAAPGEFIFYVREIGWHDDLWN